ncbi:MAG: hypothetical protein GY861_17625 [bacterium]|nr:hypothetical protein [bacterium]
MMEIICNYPQQLVMGTSALIGALIASGLAVYHKKKVDKKFKFDWKKIVDTIWQSVAVGATAGLAVGCGKGGIVMAMIGGIGIDQITNKLKVNNTQILNFVQLIIGMLTKKTTAKKK